MKADFSGYATKANLKCSDGRTIMPDAFKHMDGMKVPLVWQHGHTDPNNVLGHALLEARPDGVYAYAFFNGNASAQSAKALVQHGDVEALSIYANKLVERSKQVFHGFIREVSLVLSGANPGALIDMVSISHADGEIEELADEAIVYTGLTLEHEDAPAENVEGAEGTEVVEGEEGSEEIVEHAAGDRTVQEVYDALDDEEKDVVHYMIGAALEAAGNSAEHSELTDEEKEALEHQEGTEMTRNVFEQQAGGSAGEERHVLSHDDLKGIMAVAKSPGNTLKSALEGYALEHGIENLETLFPDPKLVNNTPEWDKRRTEWVVGVINGTNKTPFSRIKTVIADITQDAARAKGYIKGNLKKEEWFGLTKRTTTPTTVYKKQKLDRDDIVDITDLDIVVWLKGEMRLMLEEELARAILIGDGREVDDEDKIKDPAAAADGAGIRSILHDDELYAATVTVNIDDASSSPSEIVDAVVRNRKLYKGTGTPTFYTKESVISSLLLQRDSLGRRLYRTLDEVASELRVAAIVPVEVMEDEADLIGILVNLQDYNIGSDRGGEVTMFDDFDIDYNQQKYLIETRISGALVKIRSAIIVKKTASGNVLVAPAKLAFDPDTNTIDYVAQTGVTYSLTEGGSAMSADEVITEDTIVYARPASGYYFENNVEDQWLYAFNPDA